MRKIINFFTQLGPSSNKNFLKNVLTSTTNHFLQKQEFILFSDSGYITLEQNSSSVNWTPVGQ